MASNAAAARADDDDYDPYDDYSDELRALVDAGPLLLLPPSAFASYGGVPTVVRANAPVQRGVKLVEQAGMAHLRLQVAQLGGKVRVGGGFYGDRANAGAAGAGGAAGEDEGAAPSAEEKARMLAFMADGAYYSLLGLAKENLAATDEMITRAYRKLVVRYHPVKAAAHFTAAAKARQDAATKLLASRGAASAVELARAEADAKEALKQATEAKAQAEPLFLAIQRFSSRPSAAPASCSPALLNSRHESKENQKA